MPTKKEKIEVCRSYSQKVSNPKNKYENSDFFCSAKAEVLQEEFKEVSEDLYMRCRAEVIKSITMFEEERIDKDKANQEWSEKAQELYNENSKIDEIKVANPPNTTK